MRISPPPPGGPLPSLSLKSRPIYFVSFAHRPRASGGAFYDYTARYGAVRDQDQITLRQSMFPEETGLVQESIKSFIVDDSSRNHNQNDHRARRFEELTEKLRLKHLLDLPLVALSNGQTRRARIVKALLEQPDILLLDEPLSVFSFIFLDKSRLSVIRLAGLDFETRPTLLSLLHSVHGSNNPHIIMGLRLQDPIPDWITHIALVQGGRVMTGERETILKELTSHTRSVAPMRATGSKVQADILVDMKNVNVRYHERHVSYPFQRHYP